MNVVKIVIIALVAVAMAVVVLQNTDPTEIKVLFMTITMPRAAMLFGTFVAGFVVGLLMGGYLITKKKRDTSSDESQPSNS